MLTVKEVAQRSRFSEKTVRKAMARGELRASKLCGQWRILVEDFDEWIEGGTHVPRSVPLVPAAPVPPVQGSRAALRQIESEAA